MTLLAGPAEVSLMCVVASVTAVARRRQRDLGHILLVVTRSTGEPYMRARERKACLLVVIEAPASPSIRRMAESAIAAERALMVLVAMAA